MRIPALLTSHMAHGPTPALLTSQAHEPTLCDFLCFSLLEPLLTLCPLPELREREREGEREGEWERESEGSRERRRHEAGAALPEGSNRGMAAAVTAGVWGTQTWAMAFRDRSTGK